LAPVLTGTGTEVGKTVVTAAVAALAPERGVSVAVVKPAQTKAAAACSSAYDPMAARLRTWPSCWTRRSLVVTTPGLGTLNHTALTLEALSARRLRYGARRARARARRQLPRDWLLNARSRRRRYFS
jgi:dethiobiotin synthetase